MYDEQNQTLTSISTYVLKSDKVWSQMKGVFFLTYVSVFEFCFNCVQYLERVEEFYDVCRSADIAEQQLGQLVSCQVTLYNRDR